MKKKTLIILSTAIICSFLPWTGRAVSAETISAPVLVEAPDEEEAREMLEEMPGEEEIRELQEEVPDEGEIQELQEEVPGVKEEKAGISDNDLPAAGGIPIDEVHFPDSNFRQYLTVSSFDEDKDGILSEQEIKNVTSIDCRKSDSDQGNQGWGKIESLEGIGYFTELTYLDCECNGLTDLDVSQNKKLEDLACAGNDLTSLDVSQNKKLEDLACGDNDLTDLDVSQNKKLEHLTCGGNDLTSLDVSQNRELRDCYCSYNRLGSLVIGKKTKLTHLSCIGNQLEELDLTGVSQLQQLNCRENKLTDLQIGRHRKGINDIHCEDNLLTHLDLSMIEFIHELYCNDNKLSSLILGNVESVECQNNLLTELDLSNDPFVRYVDCSGNMLRSLDLSRNFLEKNNLNDIPAILRCNDNRLESIEFAEDNDLWVLYCQNNRLRSLDVKNLQKIGLLQCFGNDISTLDVRRMPILWYFHPDPGTKVVYTSAPRLVSLKRDPKKVILTWTHDEKICDGFYIYRREEEGSWKKVGEVRGRSDDGRYSYIDKYTGKGNVIYTVRAFCSMRPGADDDTYEDRQGGYNRRGLIASVVPSAPKGFRAAAGSGSAKLTWKKVSGVSGYQIYRKAPKSTRWKKIVDVKTGKTSYIDKKAKKGKTYSYCVRVYKKGTGKDKNVIVNGDLSAVKKVKIR